MSWKLAELRWRHELGLKDRNTEKVQDSRIRKTSLTKVHATNPSPNLFDQESNGTHHSGQNVHRHKSMSARNSEVSQSLYHISSLSTTPLLAHLQTLDPTSRPLSIRSPATAPLQNAHSFQHSANISRGWESRGSPIKWSTSFANRLIQSQ